MSRMLWFVAGVGAGAYGLVKARRTAEALTPDGLHDRVNGLAVGARVLAAEFRTGCAEAEEDVRRRMERRMLEITAPEPSGTLDAGPSARPGHPDLPATPPADRHAWASITPKDDHR